MASILEATFFLSISMHLRMIDGREINVQGTKRVNPSAGMPRMETKALELISDAYLFQTWALIVFSDQRCNHYPTGVANVG